MMSPLFLFLYQPISPASLPLDLPGFGTKDEDTCDNSLETVPWCPESH